MLCQPDHCKRAHRGDVHANGRMHTHCNCASIPVVSRAGKAETVLRKLHAGCVRGVASLTNVQVAVGVGTLAGSTIMLLTIAWGGSVWAGRCDIGSSVRAWACHAPGSMAAPDQCIRCQTNCQHANVARLQGRATDKQLTQGASLTKTGITTDSEDDSYCAANGLRPSTSHGICQPLGTVMMRLLPIVCRVYAAERRHYERHRPAVPGHPGANMHHPTHTYDRVCPAVCGSAAVHGASPQSRVSSLSAVLTVHPSLRSPMSAPGAGVLLPQAAAHRVTVGRHHLPRLAGGLLCLPGAVHYFARRAAMTLLAQMPMRRRLRQQPSQRGQCAAMLHERDR